MAFPTILSPSQGTVTFFSFGGIAPQTKRGVEDVSRPNVDGSDTRRLELKGDSTQVRAVVDTTMAAPLATSIAAYRTLLYALKSEIVTVTDDYGVAEANVLIEDVEIPPLNGGNPRRIVSQTGGVVGSAGNYLWEVWFTWKKKKV